MVTVRTTSFAALIALATATPAAADWWNTGAIAKGGGTTVPSAPVHSTAVPEPADFALFGAGVIGLLLGRRSSRSRKNRRDEAHRDDE